MYSQHQPVIARWARTSPENLAQVIQFCIISARQKFFNVPALVQEAHHESSGALYGWKNAAYYQAWDRRAETYWQCEDIARLGGPQQADYLLSYLAGMYGLNTAKAGFACQLAYGVSACLDSVNIKRLKLPRRFCANFFQLRTRQGRLARANRYNLAITRLGGTETLWDDWCAEISTRYPSQFPTPDHASAWHLECLGIT